MSEWLDLKTLYGVLARELENDSLQHVEPGIYSAIASMLGNLRGRGYDGLEQKIRDSLANLVGDMTRTLLNLRMDKVAAASSIAYANLTDEERFIVEAEKDRRLRLELVLSAILNGRTKVLESVAQKAKTTQILVRFVRPIQALKGVDNARYGPFEQEDVAVLPFENARALIEQGAAIELTAFDY